MRPSIKEVYISFLKTGKIDSTFNAMDYLNGESNMGMYFNTDTKQKILSNAEEFVLTYDIKMPQA